MKGQKLITKSDTEKKSPALQRKLAQKKLSDLLTRDYEPLENITCKIGDNACAAKHVSVIQRTGLFHPVNKGQKVQSLLKLQQQYGNRFVQKIIGQHALQTKLKIGQPGDRYEQEADRVAEQVIRMPELQVQRQEEEEKEEELIQTKLIAGQITPLVQREVEEEKEEEEDENVKELKTKIKKLVKDKFGSDYEKAFNHYDEDNDKGIDAKEVEKLLEDADVGNWATRGKWVKGIMERLDTNKNGKIEWSEFKAVTEESKKQEKTVQPKLETNAESLIQRLAEEKEILQTKGHPNQTSEVTPNLESRIRSLKGGGQPLPESTRAFFEPRFGHDFSQVRVHTDSKAAETAKSINAKVFTTGKDVAFGTGQYSPETSTGKRLLAHELTHVVQQKSAGLEVYQSSTPKVTNRTNIDATVAGHDWGVTKASDHVQRKAGGEPRPEEEFLEDLKSGTEKAAEYVGYITKSVDYWHKYGGTKPEKIQDAVNNLMKITDLISSGLKKFGKAIGKIQTGLKAEKWLEGMYDFAQKTQSLDLSDPDSVRAWVDSLEELHSKTTPFIDTVKKWLKGLAIRGSPVAGRAPFFLSVFTAYAEVGIAALKAGIRVETLYFEKKGEKRIAEIISGKEKKIRPTTRFPGPWYTAAEMRESAKAREEYMKRLRIRREQEKRRNEAIRVFNKKEFPKIYRRHRARIKWRILREIKAGKKKWRIIIPGGFAIVRGWGAMKWWDCLLSSGKERYFDTMAGVYIIPKKDSVTLDEGDVEIGNFMYVEPSCPFFNELYDRELEKFQKKLFS